MSGDAELVFRQVDLDGSGSISFKEFSTWWAERQLATTGAPPDGALVESVRRQWQQHDLDADGQLDHQEFATVLADVAFGDWRSAAALLYCCCSLRLLAYPRLLVYVAVIPDVCHQLCRKAYDDRKGKEYYYHRVTKEPKWSQPSQSVVVETFLQQNGMSPGMEIEAVEANRGGFSAPTSVGFGANVRRAASAKFGQVKSWNESRRDGAAGGGGGRDAVRDAKEHANEWHREADKWKQRVAARDANMTIGLLVA